MISSSNGYEDLIWAGRSLTGTQVLDSDSSPTEAEIAAFLGNNKAALLAARQALQRDCYVTVVYDGAYIEQFGVAAAALRNLAKCQNLKITDAEQRGDVSDAVRIGLDLFDLANASRRGGLILNFLVSAAIESTGIYWLRKLRRQLNEAESRFLANDLLRVEASREVFEEILAREKQWDLAVPGPSDEELLAEMDKTLEVDEVDSIAARLVQQVIRDVVKLPTADRNGMHRSIENNNVALLRLLAIEAALNAHFVARGTLPEKLQDLAPEFIGRLPIDPYNGKSFVYRRTPDGFQVYSTGPTGKDLGGQFGSSMDVQCGRADLCLDMGDYSFSCPINPPRVGLVSSVISRIRRCFR
ncbi:MAG: hypothetical protein JWM11_475 [Planctomycetaceae bacterium]|nr:hypothetical protein [Planctomycetaceae bacterium]